MAANEATKTADELRADIDRLKSDVSSLMETLGKAAEHGKDEGLRALAAARLRAQAQAEEGLETVERQIAERPFISVAIAFGAGLLIGKLLDRR